MGLETASYIAGLVESNPDGNDQRTTTDNHIRLLKASLKRTFPMLDGAVSISALGFAFLGDLSRSVQYQINQLRDGSTTALNALIANYALSASTALNAGMIGGVSLSDIAALSRTNTYLAVNIFGGAGIGSVRIYPGSNTLPGYVGFHTPEGTRRGFIGFGSGGRLLLASENSWGYDFVDSGGGLPPTITGQAALHAASSLNASNLGSGSVPDARVSLSAVQQHQASLNVNSALTASSATTATTASNANALGGYAAALTGTANTVAVRDSNGDLYARFFNQASGYETGTVDSLIVTIGDSFFRKMTLANAGAQIEARNITGRTGTAKSLASGSGPPSLGGSTNGDLFYYY